LRGCDLSSSHKSQKTTNFVQHYFAQISFRRLLLMRVCVCMCEYLISLFLSFSLFLLHIMIVT
jgi:hypothetical protein